MRPAEKREMLADVFGIPLLSWRENARKRVLNGAGFFICQDVGEPA